MKKQITTKYSYIITGFLFFFLSISCSNAPKTESEQAEEAKPEASANDWISLFDGRGHLITIK